MTGGPAAGKSRARAGGKTWAGRLSLLVCSLIACLLVVQGPNGADRRNPEARRRTAALTEATPSFKPIETIKVGERVLTGGEGSNPDGQTSVDPATWKRIHLRSEQRWDDGTLDVVTAETLQPPEWIAANRVELGAMVLLPLDLVEMGLPADLKGEVVGIEQCPDIPAGPGHQEEKGTRLD